MKKKPLEIIAALGSVAIFIVLIAAAKLIAPVPGYGYVAALLIFVVIMGTAGMKLAGIPDT